MELKEMIKVMQHFDNNGEIEYSHNKFNNVFGEAIKKHDGNLGWDWHTYTYRIKEQKQKVTIEKWLCQNIKGDFVVIITSNIDGYEYHKKVKLIETYEVEL